MNEWKSILEGCFAYAKDRRDNILAKSGRAADDAALPAGSTHMQPQMHIVIQIAQHEMPVLGVAQMRNGALVTGKISLRRDAELLRHAQVEG